LKGTRVFVVSDPGLKQAGLLDKLTAILDETKTPYDVFSDVESEPDAGTINSAAEQARSFGADISIGMGGGSAQDAAKSVAVMINNTGRITDYAGIDKIPNPGIPIICIPTTAGTGSEITIWAVISEKKKNLKFGIGGKFLAPAIALCDPMLTISLPPKVTAATGMDALVHAMESFVNKATQPISQAMARESMLLIAKSLRKAVSQGDNLEARYNMMLAASISAMAFNPTRLGLAHALCMPLGGKFHVPHGIANAILLPEVMAYNLVGNLEAYKEVAEIFGENIEGLPLREAAEQSVKAIRQLNADIGIPCNLRQYGVAEADLDQIAAEGIVSANVLVNPRRATVEDLKDIVRHLL
jgi:alcohol dehydrogenase